MCDGHYETRVVLLEMPNKHEPNILNVVPLQQHQAFLLPHYRVNKARLLSRSHLACFSGRNSRVVARFSDVFSMFLRKERRPDLPV